MLPVLTVACVWVRGNVPYPVDYVANLAAMVRRHLPAPFRFVCFTDRPHAVPPGVEPITISPLPGFGWWSKLHLFNPAHGLSGRVLYLDLDSLVVNDLSAIAWYPAPFALLADDGSQFKPRDRHKAVIKRFNSSVMTFDAGAGEDLWTSWTPATPARLWGDQDRIAQLHPDLPTLPRAWCPRLSAVVAAGGQVPAEARVILAKKPKPEQAAARWPWVEAIWSAA